MKKFLKNITIYIIVGIILGFITEFALIFNLKFIVSITQSLEFWGITMIVVAFISKEYKYAITNPIALILPMNSTYYIIRLMKSGYTNTGSWHMYNFVCIGGTLFTATLVFFIKDVLTRNKNYFRIFNLIVMTILGILFVIFNISLGLKFNNLMQYVSLGIIVAFIIMVLLKSIYTKCIK